MAPPKQKLPTPTEYQAIAAKFAAAKRAKELEDAAAATAAVKPRPPSAIEQRRQVLEMRRRSSFEHRWLWTVGFWLWMILMHVAGIYYFTSGFLLTRLVLDDASVCAAPPLSADKAVLGDFPGRGTPEAGCWHPRAFRRAVVVIIDALRYDFTVPVGDGAPYHDAFPFLHDTAVKDPHRAVLRPFIADPPTATLQRLKGLTTGTLPTFMDIGSSFAGTAIEEDNLLGQLRDAGRRIVHLGDDTWDALFPGYFEANSSRSYDSFNVWDLHTVDNGVMEHIFPLLQDPAKNEGWDVLIGHLLGVDHAGHRYGPDHPAMNEKLHQMDGFVERLAGAIDDDTLLVVMGDHGMDSKGDHGGESDDEVEAALWMYSSRPFFGRTNPAFVEPPRTAKERPVGQIDLVPTLALLLGIPIPYNNLGWPIEEAFVGTSGDKILNLVSAEQVTAAGIKRYQSSYFAARGIEPKDDETYVAEDLAKVKTPAQALQAHSSLTTFQDKTLKVYKGLWGEFDVPNMIFGIVIMALGLVVLLVYISSDEDEDLAVLDNPELDAAERNLELNNLELNPEPEQILNRDLVVSALIGGVSAFAALACLSVWSEDVTWYDAAGWASLPSMAAVIVTLLHVGKKDLTSLLPSTIWGWLAIIFTVSQSVGFASNSYTIWEDSIMLFFLVTFGFVAASASLSLPSVADRTLSTYHSVLFVVLARIASFSKLCREEQMPYCTSTYYASATSSTSAPWQLVIPFVVFAALPSILKAYFTKTASYQGLAPLWVGSVVRLTLGLAALYWTLDAADNGGWGVSFGIEGGALKPYTIAIAQGALAISLVAGTAAFIFAPPCIDIEASATPSTGATTITAVASRAKVHIYGYANTHGARYLLLPLNFYLACALLSKPMGAGALAIMAWQVLCLLEILDHLSSATPSPTELDPTPQPTSPFPSPSSTPIGAIVLALLANFTFFKTGHQAALSSVQWDAAFIPFRELHYPWSPLIVIFNTLPGHVLAASAVPLLALWKTGPRRKGLLDAVSRRALGGFVAFFAVEALATMVWAGHLRRHLMLFRIFNPRFMTAALMLLFVDAMGVVVALVGVRWNFISVGDVFGWAE